MHYILFYDYVKDVAERRAPYREGHLANIHAERDAGRLVMAGALGDPMHGGVLIFKDVEPTAIERFVAADPYMEAGLIAAHRIEPWNVV
jgi:uncharacterized protein YciI